MKIRFSLQIKATAVLVIVVVSAAGLGGWISNRLLSEWMSKTQTDHAGRVAEMLRVSVAEGLTHHNIVALQRGARDFLSQQDVLAVSIHDADGHVLARACRDGVDASILPRDGYSAELAYTREIGQNRFCVARPVLAGPESDRKVVGSVRIALNGSAAADRLHRAQTTMGLLILGLVLSFVPLSHTLVWRFLIRPIQRLVKATGQLAQGDYGARADHAANDEIGSLARSFNAMAEQIDRQHRQLVAYNEHLEDVVRRRTGELDKANTKLRLEMDDHQDFLRAVSHDLNAPLRNIGGMTAMMIMKFADQLPVEMLSRLERIQANVDAQTDLINDLLELSRIGTRASHPEWVDLGELLEQVKASFEFDLRKRSIELQIAPDMPVLFIERNQARQVFGNLVDNAIKYIGPRDDGHIEITHECGPDEHIFHVTDNGIGIEPEDCKRIFVVFRRAAAAPADTTGKGVGLASVSAIAVKYKGRAWVDSEPGRGSVFHVSFARRACMPAEGQEGNQDNDNIFNHNETAVHSAG